MSKVTADLIAKSGWSIDGLRKAILSVVKRDIPDSFIIDFSQWSGITPDFISIRISGSELTLTADHSVSSRISVLAGKSMTYYDLEQ